MLRAKLCNAVLPSVPAGSAAGRANELLIAPALSLCKEGMSVPKAHPRLKRC